MIAHCKSFLLDTLRIFSTGLRLFLRYFWWVIPLNFIAIAWFPTSSDTLFMCYALVTMLLAALMGYGTFASAALSNKTKDGAFFYSPKNFLLGLCYGLAVSAQFGCIKFFYLTFYLGQRLAWCWIPLLIIYTVGMIHSLYYFEHGLVKIKDRLPLRQIENFFVRNFFSLVTLSLVTALPYLLILLTLPEQILSKLDQVAFFWIDRSPGTTNHNAINFAVIALAIIGIFVAQLASCAMLSAFYARVKNQFNNKA